MNVRTLLLIALLPGAGVSAQVTLPKILASHMVVQRDFPVHVWGMAAPGEDVSVTFRGETRSAKAGPLGRWSVYLPPGAAGGPFQLLSRVRRRLPGAYPRQRKPSRWTMCWWATFGWHPGSRTWGLRCARRRRPAGLAERRQ